MRSYGWAAGDDVYALAGDVDAAVEGIENTAAGSVTDPQPRDLRGTKHPCGGVGGVVNLFEVVGGGDVEIGGLGVQLLADTVVWGDGAIGGDAEVFVVFEEDLLVISSDEVAGYDRADASACRPLDEVVDECWRELAEAQGVFLDLLREEIERRGRFTVRRSKVEPS